MASANPFRPAQRETYEQQLDLSAPSGNQEGEELLVDVGLSSSTAQQPKFLESSATPLTSGPLGPTTTNKLLTGSTASGTATADSTQTSGTASGSAVSRICGFLSVEYYRPYFDVSSAAVLDRIKGGMSPHKSDLFGGSADSPPDLYGAVWISLTLVFLIGATSNLNSYFAHSSTKEPWERDYRLLTFASTMVFVYTFAIPLIVWAASLYVGVDPRPSLLKLISTYGYTMSIFVPASLLCVIPHSAAQWVVVLLAGGLSGVVLVRNVWNLMKQNYSAVSQDTEAQTTSLPSGEAPARSKTAFLLVCTVAALHGVFSLLLKLFFFQGADFGSVVDNDAAADGKGKA